MTDNIELIQLIELVANEKGLNKDTVTQIIGDALAQGANDKLFEGQADCTVVINPQTGSYTTYRQYSIKEKPENIWLELTVEQAKHLNEDAKIGDIVDEVIPNEHFGRIDSHAIRQGILFHLHKAQCLKVFECYKDSIGKIYTLIVKRVTQNNVFLELPDQIDGVIAKQYLLPREVYTQGNRMCAVLHEVLEHARFAQLIFRRDTPEMLQAMLEREIPEIGEGVIEVLNIAREAGFRSKIVVRSKDKRIDPVGACVGTRGVRIRAITNEFNGERIDIVLYSDDIEVFIKNSMGNLSTVSIDFNHEKKTVSMLVEEEELSRAIGRGGQNVRIASQITGYNIQVISRSGDLEQKKSAREQLLKSFMEVLNIDKELAAYLYDMHFDNLEKVAMMKPGEISLEADAVEELISRAKRYFLARCMQDSDLHILMSIDGINNDTLLALYFAGICSRKDLIALTPQQLSSIIGDDDSCKKSEIVLRSAKSNKQ